MGDFVLCTEHQGALCAPWRWAGYTKRLMRCRPSVGPCGLEPLTKPRCVAEPRRADAGSTSSTTKRRNAGSGVLLAGLIVGLYFNEICYCLKFDNWHDWLILANSLWANFFSGRESASCLVRCYVNKEIREIGICIRYWCCAWATWRSMTEWGPSQVVGPTSDKMVLVERFSTLNLARESASDMR